MQMGMRMQGSEEMARTLAQMEDAAAGDALGRVAVAGAYVVAERAIQNVVANSFDNGQLANSLAEPKVIVADRTHAIAQIGPTPEHGLWVEYGTGVYGTGPGATHERIRPKTAKVLFWVDARGKHFAKSIAGMKPRPFLRPALDESHDTALTAMAAAQAEEIRRVTS
jgi:hypothetical protein